MSRGPASSLLSLWQRRTSTIALVAATLLGGCAASGPEAPPRRIFLITVDTLRADHTSAYGYPRKTTPGLEQLASQGLLFEHAVTQWPKTGPSFTVMFTGQYPQTTGLTHDAAIHVPDGYLMLPELLHRAGWTTAAVVSNAVLSAELGWNRGFDEFEETWHTAGGMSGDPQVYRKTINAPRVNELALPLLERHKDDAHLFVWLHYSDPHAPYVLPDGYENPFLGDAWYHAPPGHEGPVPLVNPPAQALGDHRELEYYVAQYDANALVADRAIHRVLERARELGMLDDALVVFTSDHGESLGEHDYYFEHGRLPYSPCSHVPLVVWAPGRVPAGERVERPVELVDLYPTLRDLAAPGTEVEGLEGHSLLPFLRGQEPPDDAFRYAYLEAGGGTPTTHFRAVEDERWKLVYHPAFEGRDPLFELYDQRRDPLDTEDSKETDRQQARRLHDALFAWMKGTDWIRRGRTFIEDQSEQTRKALKALGYVN